MRAVEISEAAISLTEYGRKRRGETLVLVRKGKPVAAVVPLDEEDYFSMRLANNPEFIEIIERSRESARKYGTIPLAEIERELDIKPPRKRKVARKSLRKAG
jgi:antitoxin (DNA-binding transcriptional repressor) of toxin-antitoxin stability system